MILYDYLYHQPHPGRKGAIMQPDIRWLDDPRVFRVNRLDAHSDHVFYAGEEAYAAKENTLCQCLDGVWKFAYAKNAAERPADFYKEETDVSGYDDIKVPGHIEMEGYDKIHYINTKYPWEGVFFRRPTGSGHKAAEADGEFSGADYNPVGSYVCMFDLDEALVGKRVVVRFEGVEQAMYVWLNGQFIGYAEDTFTPSEFDLTAAIREKGNKLAVEVHKRSTAAYLEDQDFFRFFGIFRSVSLLGLPKVHVQDMWIRPRVNLADKSGKVELDLKLTGETANAKVDIRILDKGVEIAGRKGDAGEAVSVELPMPEPVTLYDNHSPYLYTLEIRVTDENGEVVEIVPWRFGFNKIEIGEDKVVYYNGKRFIINGVNRHEWNARSGRCITAEDEQWDIECFHRNNINAVRTCHYPDRISFYNLCDEHGIYMMAETNLESHGTWQKSNGLEPSWNVPGDNPAWYPVVLDRAESNFEWFKNHTSVLFWSLGNESYVGEGVRLMNEYFKKKDPARLVHYESSFYNRAYEDSVSDMESRMYATPAEIREYLTTSAKKPYILCEYMHDMGNSLGGMDSYMKLLDEFPMYMGGFIWDYIDQAIFVKDDVTGREVLRYGGDFDDRPSDYEFSANGIVFADRTEKPAMQEVKYYYGQYDK